MVFDVKPADIQALLNSVKSMIPFLTPPTASEVQQEQEDMEKEAASSQEKGTVMGWIRGRLENSDPKVLQFFTNAVLALAVTKLFSPFKLGITILITPTVARRLKALGFKFGPTTATRKGI